MQVSGTVGGLLDQLKGKGIYYYISSKCFVASLWLTMKMSSCQTSHNMQLRLHIIEHTEMNVTRVYDKTITRLHDNR